MVPENNSKPVSRSTLPQIIFGALVGILLGIAGVLIYQGYLGQITGILLYVSLVFFGVVVLTFILVWGFKTYLTRLLFGSKVADSPDLIAEAQSIASQLSDGVIDKVMEKATPEQRENAKGLVLRLGNWFVWGRLRNWWWNWILGIFVSLGGLTGTLLLVNQNELLSNQNELLVNQNKLVQNQMSLEEASRRGSLVVLMSNIFDKVDDEIAEQKAEMRRQGKVVTDSTKFSISQSLIGQIAALSQAFKPYRFMDGDTMIGRPLSPERGQLLVTICGLPLDTGVLRRIYTKSIFREADLKGVNLSRVNLSSADLRKADLSGAYLSSADLIDVVLIDANLSGANLSRANLSRAYLSGANLSRAYLNGANLSRAYLNDTNLSRAYLNDTNLREADLEGAHLIDADLSGGADLSSSNLSGADLSRAYLSGANLSRADLMIANLTEANLGSVDLRKADLSAADLNLADLGGADLSGANLTVADLSGANLTATNLNDACLSWANLNGVINLTKDQVIKAITLYKCKLPKNINVSNMKKEKPELFKNPGQ